MNKGVIFCEMCICADSIRGPACTDARTPGCLDACQQMCMYINVCETEIERAGVSVSAARGSITDANKGSSYESHDDL